MESDLLHYLISRSVRNVFENPNSRKYDDYRPGREVRLSRRFVERFFYYIDLRIFIIENDIGPYFVFNKERIRVSNHKLAERRIGFVFDEYLNILLEILQLSGYERWHLIYLLFEDEFLIPSGYMDIAANVMSQLAHADGNPIEYMIAGRLSRFAFQDDRMRSPEVASFVCDSCVCC